MSNIDAQPQTDDSTSRSLLERVKARDAVAWQKLSRVYGPLVYQWCRRARLQDSDAADVVQEVFRAVYGGIDGFQKDCSTDTFRGWLWTITRNRIYDFFRQQGQQPEVMGGSGASVAMQDLPGESGEEDDDSAQHSVKASLTRRALALMQQDFQDRTWQAFWQTTVEEQDPAHVGQQLGMTRAAVYMAKARVLRRLRQELDGLDLIE